MAKKKSKKKRTRGQKGTPVRVRALLALMVLVVAGGIAAVKFFQTNRGKVLLMDAGFAGYYGQVQQDLDRGLRHALTDAGLARSLKESRGVQETRDGRFLHHVWKVTCDPPCNFIDVNLQITRAVRRVGGIVRSGAETQPDRGSRALVFDIGSRRYTTHRITVEKGITQPGGVTRTGDRPVVPRRGVPRAALVFDDFGYSKSDLVEAFFTFELPITISVLPSLPHSRYAITRARANGKELLLHLPMEAEKGSTSDVAAVLIDMSNDEIRALVARHLAGSPGVVGVNNHQGSLATQDRRVMRNVLSVVKRKNLFFLDSLTSSKSIAYNTARDLGIPAARNGIFLDADTKDVLVIEERLLRLLEIARKQGSVIGIGHPRPATLAALKRNLEILKDSGVEFVFVSALVN